MKNKEVFVFIGGQNILKGVFDSHNIKFLEKMYKYGVLKHKFVLVTFICKSNLSSSEQKIVKSKKDAMLKIAKKYNFNLDFYQINGRTMKALFSSCDQIADFILEKDLTEPLFWAHNYYNGFIAFLLKRKISNAYFHLDLKGIPPEEELYYGEGNLVSRLFKFFVTRLIGRFAIKSADSISVVSNRFREYIYQKYKYKKDVYVYPSVYDKLTFKFDNQIREKMREKHKIKSNERVVFYSGSFQNWQLPDTIFRFFKKIEDSDRKKKIKKYIFTRDIEKAKLLAKKYEVNDIVIKSLDVSELVKYLCMGDIGIICRKDDLVNNFASPTKIAEYIATRNSVILTESIGDYGFHFKNKPFAIVCKDVNSFLTLGYDSILNLKKPNDNFLKNFEKEYSEKRIINYKKIFAK